METVRVRVGHVIVCTELEDWLTS